MANEKIINTRIALRTGDFAYWTTGAGKDLSLYKGEVCICTVATTDNQATTAPTVLFKVCNTNGQKFADLNWVSGLAADVYAWAKKETPDWTDFPALPLEVIDNGTGKFITGFTYAANKLTITRDDAVNTLTAKDDDVVILTADKSKGDVTITAAHRQVTKADDTKTAAPDHEGTFAAVTGVTYDDYGHVSGVETTTFTLPEDENTTYKLEVVKDTSAGKITFTPSEGDANSIYFNGLDSIYVNSANGYINFSINANNDFGRDSNNSSQLALSKAVHDSLALADTAVQPDDLGDLAAKDNITHDLVTDFDTAVAAVKVTNAGHADAADEATHAGTADEATHATSADNATTATTAEKVANALTVGSKTYDGSSAVEVTAADLGLESAMHFIGALSAAPDSAKPGDVYLNTATKKEYVYDKANGWIELGDEGSYALRSITITGTDGLTGGGDLTKNQTISHAVPTGAAAQTKGGDTANPWGVIDKVTTDKFGHITEITTKTLDTSRFVLKDFSITAKEGLEGGGAINGTSVTIGIADKGVTSEKLADAVNTDIAKGVTAHGWGNHAEAGYLKSGDIADKADKVTGATAGNFAGLDANGNLTDSGKKADDFATAEALNTVSGVANDAKTHASTNAGLIKDNTDRIKALEDANHISEVTTTENGGLKVTNKNQIDIDDEVVFVLNCNW